MGCTETVVSIENVLFNGVGDWTILVRGDEDLALDGVESELVHGGGRRMARRCGDDLRESNESEEKVCDGGSHLV